LYSRSSDSKENSPPQAYSINKIYDIIIQKATFKVAFSHSGEEEVVIAEYREDNSIKRELLIKNYSDIDKSSDIYRIIEKLKSRHDKYT